MNDSPDLRQYAPATERNRVVILDVLRQVLPPTGTVLEISSGTGEHAIFFASQLHPRHWLPSDPNPVARNSILAWQQYHPTENLHPPIALDVHDARWPVEQPNFPEILPGIDWVANPIRAIVNINMIHIAPWSACLALLAGAERILPSGGVLYLYGPFRQGGQHTAPSNAAFDESLRSQNPAWGVRDLDEVIAVAQSHHLIWKETIAMPANNLSVIFQVEP